jgi:hypothetical protein
LRSKIRIAGGARVPLDRAGLVADTGKVADYRS